MVSVQHLLAVDLSVIPEARRVAEVEIQSSYTPPRVCGFARMGAAEQKIAPVLVGILNHVQDSMQTREAFAVTEIGEQVVEEVANVSSQP